MRVDLQLSFTKLQELIKQRIRATWKGYADPITWQGDQCYVSGIRVTTVTLQLASATSSIVLNTLDGDDVITPETGGFTVSTRPLEAVLTGEVLVSKVEDMKASNIDAPPVIHIPILAAVLTLTIGIEDGEIMFRARLKSIPGAEDLDDDVKAKFSVKNKINLRSALGGTAADALPAIVNAGLAASDDLSFAAIRLDTSIPNETVRASWENFYEGHLTDQRGGNDWALSIPKQIVVDPLVENLKDQVDDSDSFQLTSSPTGSWAPVGPIPAMVMEFSGEAIDACAGIDMDVDVHLDVFLSVPQPNKLRAKIVISLDYNEAEETACVLAMGFLWPIFGPITLADQSVDYAGWITLGGIFVDWPWRLIAAIVFIEGDSALEWMDTGKMTVDPDDDHIRYMDIPFSSNANLFGGKLNLLSVSATQSALVMRGSMTIEDPIAMEFKTGWVPFDGWYTKNACRDPFACVGYMKIFPGGAPWGEPPRLPIRIARLSVMSADPNGTYGHRSWSGVVYDTWLNSGEFSVKLSNPKSEFEDNPYPLEVLIVSNNGVRWITLPPPPPTPKPPQDSGGVTGWKAKYLAWKASHCWKHINDWDLIHALWVLWKVDPGPEREYLRHWLVDVAGLRRTDALSLFDEGTGRELTRMKPGADGRATATALVAPSARNRSAGVVVGLNGKFMSRADWDRARAGVAPPTAEPATMLGVRQILFRKERTLRLPRAAESVRLDSEGGVPVLHVADRCGVSVISLAPGESPVLLRQLDHDARGSARTALLRDRTATLVDDQIVSSDAAVTLGAYQVSRVERIGRAPIRGLRYAVWMKRAAGYEIVDLSEPAKPVTLGISAARPWYVDATRLGSLYARLADDRRSVALYRIGKAVEGLEPPVRAAELIKP